LGVHPLDLTPDGRLLLLCNTADHRLEIYDVTAATPVHLLSISVRLDPLPGRARSNTEAWGANHISDSISIGNLTSRRVIETVQTLDEPSDIVFAGNPQRAFVSWAQVNSVQVFDPAEADEAHNSKVGKSRN
jgi:hypothetical protein